MEVGRIEEKLLQLLRRPPGGEGPSGEVPDWIEALLELLFSIGDSVTYTMPRPCDVDAEGNPLPPLEVTAPGALNQFEVIQNRIDALAELLAIHKTVKQPNCSRPRAAGQPVTVTFEEAPEV